jgi:ribonuclease VapC
MFVDSSAATAILLGEPDADELTLKLKGVSPLLISPLVCYETTLAVARAKNIDIQHATSVVERMVLYYGMRIIGISEEIGRAAIIAFTRFGKGRHPAALNMGDCFSYACARLHRVPILCKGNDFGHTDIQIA